MKSNYDVGLSVWLHTGSETIFCQGRALLLEGIEEHGSLRQAAKSLGMSYRAAWGKLKKTQDILGIDLVVLSGEQPRRYELTSRAREILNAFNSWRNRMKTIAGKEARELQELFKGAGPEK